MRRCMGNSGYHPPYDIFALRLISSILEEMELALVLKSASRAKYKIFRLQDSTIPTPLRLIVGLKR